MKYTIFFLMIAPVFCFAQDCKLVKAIDPYTKEKTISTGFIPAEGAKITIDANKAEIDMLFTLEGSDKCFTDASTATLFFEGGKLKQMQRNSGSMNCEGLFHFIFRNGVSAPPLLRRVATQKVEKILFVGNNKKETTVTLTPEQQQKLMEKAACMVAEAPTLMQ